MIKKVETIIRKMDSYRAPTTLADYYHKREMLLKSLQHIYDTRALHDSYALAYEDMIHQVESRIQSVDMAIHEIEYSRELDFKAIAIEQVEAEMFSSNFQHKIT